MKITLFRLLAAILFILPFILPLQSCSQQDGLDVGQNVSSKKSVQQNSIIRSTQQLESLVFNDFFNSSLHTELARSHYNKFLQSSLQDDKSYHGSQCLTEYAIAVSEMRSNHTLRKEAEFYISSLLDEIGYQNISASDFLDNGIELYERLTRPWVNLILVLKKDYDTLLNKKINDSQKSRELQIICKAVISYIRRIYDVEIGKQRVVNPQTGGTFKFAAGFYKPWEEGLRGYGVTCRNSEELVACFMIEKVDPALIDRDFTKYSKVTIGQYTGLFARDDGSVFIPGIEFLNKRFVLE